MRGRGKWIAGTILLLAVVVGGCLYQRDRHARYPLDFDLDQVKTVTLSNVAATLTLTEPEDVSAVYGALERMRVTGEAEQDNDNLLGNQVYILRFSLKEEGDRMLRYDQRSGGSGGGILSRSGYPACEVRCLNLAELWKDLSGEYPPYP